MSTTFIGEEALQKEEIQAAIFVRSPYNYDKDFVSEVTGLECLDESLADQSQAEDADINTIVKRFGLTGRMPDNPRVPQYGDFTSISDFRSALDAVEAASQAFMQFPAALRARFDHDPQVFLEFCSDASNLPEMRKLGLAVQAVSEAGSSGEAAGAAPEAPQAPAGAGS